MMTFIKILAWILNFPYGISGKATGEKDGQ